MANLKKHIERLRERVEALEEIVEELEKEEAPPARLVEMSALELLEENRELIKREIERLEGEFEELDWG